MRKSIGSLPPDLVAVLLLSFEAGKVMVHSFEGGRWLKKSNYPQLAARSVLHSVESLASEYDYTQRTLIRQAIIYSSRSGDFGPVKLPVNLNIESRALRQWGEILLSTPYELGSTADEVELYGLIFEA